ncbi:MAG TPA: carboxypeptidase regulatory-like domain-containing protein [Terriglobales bacterium]|nr:carboxypeptidase regulatory-like domain-containing protein [Terriglobales bacterium]
MSAVRFPRIFASQIRSLITGIVCVLLAAGALAQNTTTTVVGTVTDNTGAAVAGATVTITNTDTNLVRNVKTDADGSYRVEFLPVGNYQLEATSSGFKTYQQQGIVLTVNQIARIDVKLAVGVTNEVITVMEATPLINTTTAEIGRTIESQEISSLPLVDRNVYTLLDLTPGVQSNNNGVATASSGTSSLVLGYPEQRTLINGGTDGGTGSVNYFLDGGVNMTGLRNTGNILPNPDAIQEFRVQTNSYSAEYGRFASGIINVLTKTGTNKFHGSFFEFVRNTMFNANDWASKLEKPSFHRNQFGATIGGPIIKDKTFFFFSYSGLRQTTSTFLNGAVVPTALERTGDFSQSKTKPTDPATGATFVCNGVSGVICPGRLDPVAMRIITDYIPLSNLAGSKWQGYVPSPYDTNEFLIKLDHQLSNSHRLSGSYFETSGVNTVRAGSGNLPWGQQQFEWRQHNINISDTWVIGNTRVNQAWVTYTRNFGGRLNIPQTSLGDLGSTFAIQGTPSLPQINVSGYFNLTNSIGGPVAGTNFYSLRDVFSWSKGRHAFKFGGELSLNKDIQQTLLNNYGTFTFSNAVTKNALADFLLGIPSSLTQDAPVTGYTNSWYTALFAQDDFRIAPRLTLNLGLRWDIQTPPTDPQDRATTYVAGQKSTVNSLAPVGQLFYGDPGVERGVVPMRWHHVSPRIGFAYDPWGDGKTSIRAAAGLFFGSVSGNEWNTMTNFQPYSIRLTFSNANTKTDASGNPLGATLRDPYHNYVGGNPFPYQGTFVNGGGIFGVSKDFQWPYSYQLNFSVQQQVTSAISVTGAYVGTLSHRLPFGRDVNYPALTPTATNSGANVLSRRPNPLFGAVLLLDSDQNASYHAMQWTATMRMNRHLAFNGYYVWSKTLSTVQLHNNTTQGLAQNYSNLAEDRGRADTDQRHTFSLALNYQPDYYNGGSALWKHVLNGWSISPIVKLRSGVPFTVTNGNVDANLDGNTNDRAQLVGDPYLDNPTADMWFNTAAFKQNKIVTGVATDGSAPRNLLDGPGFRVIDLAISRDFRLTERFTLKFRAEGTNAFNMVSLGTPGASVPSGATSTTFGVISSAAPMRKMQFGLRLTY